MHPLFPSISLQAAAAHPPPPPPPPPAPSPPSPPPPAAPAQGDDGSTPAASTSASRTPITDSLRTKLTVALQPTVLTIVNQSDQHAGHAGVRTLAGKAASTGETHFRVEIVSAAFESMTLVKRQRAVYQLLAEEFSQGLHALSLDTKTPAEAAKAAAR